MNTRCYYKKTREYPKYGGRGIVVCGRWKVFENFLADLGECPGGYSLERIDVNGNYEPSNCKWIPWKEQYDNTRQTRILEFGGERLTMAKWSRKTGIKRNTIEYRIASGWPLGRALSTTAKR